MWVYIVWVQKVCIRQDNLAKQNVSQVSRGNALPASYSLTRELLAKHICLHPILTLHIPDMCKAHASLRGMLSRELPAETLQSSICLESSNYLSYTQPLQLNPTLNTGYKRLNRITIKFGIKLKPIKHIVVNYNFTTSLHEPNYLNPYLLLPLGF